MRRRGCLAQANVAGESGSRYDGQEREGQEEQVEDAERQPLKCVCVTELFTKGPSGRYNLKTQKSKIELVFLCLPSFGMQISQ